jgi:hypothetical protein
LPRVGLVGDRDTAATSAKPNLSYVLKDAVHAGGGMRLWPCIGLSTYIQLTAVIRPEMG